MGVMYGSSTFEGFAMTAKEIRDPDFGKRFAQACDQHPDVPPFSSGRLVWIQRGLSLRFDIDVTIESVSKCYHGAARPRTAKMKALAALLEVDEAWLSLGVGPHAKTRTRDRQLRDASVDGAMNIVAGFIQMNGGRPAFPDEKDKRAADAHIDIYAIIKGAQMNFHVSTCQDAGDGKITFSIPANHDEIIVIGVVPVEPLRCVFLELTSDIIDEQGDLRGGYRQLHVTKDGNRFKAGDVTIPQIHTFGSRSMQHAD